MQNLKVPGLNFDIFNTAGAKDKSQEATSNDVDAGSEANKAKADASNPPTTDAAAAKADTTGVQDGNRDLNEALAEHELLWSSQYTYDEFIDSLSVPLEERGETANEKRHWSYPRRWQVKLHNLKIVNCVNDSLTCFAEFDFGGSRSECRVLIGGSVCILNKGETKNYIRTPVVQNVTKDVPRAFNCTNDFEYRGSYLDLEHEKLKIKLWKYRPYTVNALESVFEGKLLDFATGDIHVEIPMYRGMNKQRILRCKISFDLYFQELYDFELSFLGWRVNDVPSFVELLHKGNEAIARLKPGATATAGKTKQKEALWSTMSFSLIDKLSYYIIRRKLERDYAKDSSLLKVVPDNNNDTNGENQTREFMDPYKLILQCQEEIVAKSQTASRLKHSLPSLKLQIYVRTDSAYRYVTSLSISSLVSRNSKNAYWENMGELLFRGTLLDLERAELEIDVIDTNAPKSVNKVGRVVLPLSGIADYPYIKSKLGKPKWLSLKANMEGWGPILDRMAFGNLSGKVQILRKPRYRQHSAPYDHTLNSHPIMLVVTVGGIDQLIYNEDSGDIDSYVEVTFNKVTHRTYVCKNNRAPLWNEDILLPFCTNESDRITSLALFSKGPIRFTVWGNTKQENKILYLGDAMLSIHEIFYSSKGNLKPKVKKTYSEKGGNGNNYDSRVFDTRLFSGPLKLSFLKPEDHQSTLTVSAWIYPDIPEDILPEQFDPKMITPEQPRLLPPQLCSVYQRLIDDWSRVVELKVKPVFKSLKSVPVECVTQYHQRMYLPCLIAPMHPPIGIYTPNAIFHMIRCIPFVRKNYENVFTPDFLMKMKGGGAFDHCILQCSYLRGLIPPQEAFICVGTTQDDRNHVWMATFSRELNGSVKLWETTTGEIHVLKNRISTDDTADETIEERRLKLKTNFKLPYKTLLYMFNDKNIWLNIQGFSDPQLLLYDLNNTELWYPFSPLNLDVDPCFVPDISYTKVSEYELERVSREMQQSIERYVTAYRYAQNLQTRWNKDEALNEFLITGLKLLHQINTCPDVDVHLAKCELQEWKMLLNKNIPQSHHVIVVPLHFNTMDSVYITDSIKTNIPMLDSRERFVTFAMACSVISVPGNLFSVYILILVAQKIHERVRIRLVMEKERLAQRKRKKRLEIPVDEDSNEIENREDSLDDRLKAALENNLEMTGDDARLDKKYSSLVEVIDNNLQYQDSQLSKLMSNLLSKSSSKASSSDNISYDSSAVSSLISRDVSSSAGGYNNLNSGSVNNDDEPYEPSMSINYANLDSSPLTSPEITARRSSKMTISSKTSMGRIGSDVPIESLMNMPSYDIHRGRSGKASPKLSNKSSKSSKNWDSHGSLNPNLISNSSYGGKLGTSDTVGIADKASNKWEESEDEIDIPPLKRPSEGDSTLRIVSREIPKTPTTSSFGGSMASRLRSESEDEGDLNDGVLSNLMSNISLDRGIQRDPTNEYLNSRLVSRVTSGGYQEDNASSTSSQPRKLESYIPKQTTVSDLESENDNLVSHGCSIDSALQSDAGFYGSFTKTTTKGQRSGSQRRYSSSVYDYDDQVSNANLISDSDGESLAYSNRSSTLPPEALTRESSLNDALLSRVPSVASVKAASVASSVSPPSPDVVEEVHVSTVEVPPFIQKPEDTVHMNSKSFENEEDEPKPIRHMQRKGTIKNWHGNTRNQANLNRRLMAKEKQKKAVHEMIEIPEDIKRLDEETSTVSDEDTDRTVMYQEESHYSGKVSFAENATLYSSNKTSEQVRVHGGDTPSRLLARSLFDKSKVREDQWDKPPDRHRGVCDFKYVDLFRGFL